MRRLESIRKPSFWQGLAHPRQFINADACPYVALERFPGVLARCPEWFWRAFRWRWCAGQGIVPTNALTHVHPKRDPSYLLGPVGAQSFLPLLRERILASANLASPLPPALLTSAYHQDDDKFSHSQQGHLIHLQENTAIHFATTIPWASVRPKRRTTALS